MNCGGCKYFADFSDLSLGLRCMNSKNSPTLGDFKEVTSPNSTCSYFSGNNLEERFEWDENKNNSNQKKHKISFERIYDLVQDPNMLSVSEVPEKWEDVSNLPEHVERNDGNLDPLRSKWIGMIDGNLYTAVITFRGAIGDMRSRVISLRRSEKKDIRAYESVKESR